MSYTLFFLFGLPLWLIPVAYILRNNVAQLPQKSAWAAMTFLAPFLIFSLGAVGNILVQQRFDGASSSARAYGYFIVLLNILAFFSPFVLQIIFRTRYGKHQGAAAPQTRLKRNRK